jgi:hypothetical protein
MQAEATFNNRNVNNQACIAHLVIHISIVESGLSLHCSFGYSHFYSWKWPQPALLTWLFTFLLLKVASACIAHLVIHISIVESGLSLHWSLGYSHFYLGSNKSIVSKTRIANCNHVFHQNEIKWGLFVDDFKCIICIM